MNSLKSFVWDNIPTFVHYKNLTHSGNVDIYTNHSMTVELVKLLKACNGTIFFNPILFRSASKQVNTTNVMRHAEFAQNYLDLMQELIESFNFEDELIEFVETTI